MRLDQFNPSVGFDRGAGKVKVALWYLCKRVFFLSVVPWPYGLKRALLKAFGAQVGVGVVFKPRLNIHFPWKLVIGDHCWLGEEVCLLNFEPITLGNHVCISQRAYVCAGNHDFRDPAFGYRNRPITLSDGVWLGACTFVAPGVTVGTDSVIGAGSVVTQPVPANVCASGNPCSTHRPRWKKPQGEPAKSDAAPRQPEAS
jgi:putative colanic acid biosynthesis acetyltransferase WcaF